MVWVRGCVVAVLVAAGLSVATANPAAAASTAHLGEVTCSEEQGRVDLTVTADPAAPGDVHVLFILGSTSNEEHPLELVPGDSVVIPLTDLDDDQYTLEVLARVEGLEEDFATVLNEEFEVVCDAAPEGPYTNPKAEIHDYCGHQVDVFATNRPIGGNTADLQPVTFRFTATKDGVTDTLAEFVLPDTTDDPYTHTAVADLSSYYPDAEGSGGEDPSGDNPSEPTDSEGSEGSEGSEDPVVSIELSITADGTELAATEHYGDCVAVAIPSSGEGGPAVVNSGA